MGFVLEVWPLMSGYEWIPILNGLPPLAIAFDQPDFMRVSQLQRYHDIIAQLEVCYL